MKEPLKIIYDFKFPNAVGKSFEMLLDRDSLSLVGEQDKERPDWARLDFHQCSNCPLNITLLPFCPIAQNMTMLTREFHDTIAADRVTVTVTVKERLYTKNTSMQEGLSPLLGIIMTASGCPVMEPLKPMVRYHLPFASLDETVFRMTAMYFMAQFLRAQAGKQPEWSLEGLAKIYNEVKKLNKDFGQRMIAASHSDANIRALVKLNVFAVMVPLEAEKVLKDITPNYSAYLK
ncbi:MAG TPA: hypothetical protein VK654_10425 [Nitrospirota bacterium]|nr:hypothetical protein [Nitrospirota bacterium]